MIWSHLVSKIINTHRHNGHQVCMSSVSGAVVYCHWLQLHSATGLVCWQEWLISHSVEIFFLSTSNAKWKWLPRSKTKMEVKLCREWQKSMILAMWLLVTQKGEVRPRSGVLPELQRKARYIYDERTWKKKVSEASFLGLHTKAHQ